MFYICLESDAVAFFLLYSFGQSLDHGLVKGLGKCTGKGKDKKMLNLFLHFPIFLSFPRCKPSEFPVVSIMCEPHASSGVSGLFCC